MTRTSRPAVAAGSCMDLIGSLGPCCLAGKAAFKIRRLSFPTAAVDVAPASASTYVDALTGNFGLENFPLILSLMVAQAAIYCRSTRQLCWCVAEQRSFCSGLRTEVTESRARWGT